MRRKKSNVIVAEKPYARRLLSLLLLLILGAVIIHLLLQFLNLNVYHQQNGQIYELSNRFDLDDEASVATWLSQVFFLILGSLAALCAYVQYNKSVRLFWGMIAGVGLLLSVDEIAGLHEYILQTLHVLFFQDASPSGFANAWLIVMPFVLVLGAWTAWVALRYLPRRTVYLFVFSGSIFLIGAVAVDLLASLVEREWFLNQGLFVAAEESLELLATALFIYTTANYLEFNYGAQIHTSLRHLKHPKNSKEG